MVINKDNDLAHIVENILVDKRLRDNLKVRRKNLKKAFYNYK